MEKGNEGVKSVLKYAVTGVSAWVIDNGLFSVLKWIFGVHDLFKIGSFTVNTLALFTVIAMLTGFVFSFLTNRSWTFKSDGRVVRQFIRCVLLLVFNMAVTAAVVTLASYTPWEFLPDVVKYTMSGVTGVWNYFAYKHWVYRY